ncbi:MAG: isochorismatase family protein [Bacteroidota bacterium]
MTTAQQISHATTTLPRTILDMVGAALPTATLADAVLLVIDAQQEYVDGRLPLPGIEASLAVGARLLARARAAGTPVVHVLHRGSGALFNPDGGGFAPIPVMAPQAGEPVVHKGMANAFAGTELLKILQETGRRQLLVIGYMTHNCVSSTVRAGLDLGYRSTVVAAATGTRDLPDGRGGRIAAASLQAACLAGLADTIAKVAGGEEDIADRA